MMLLNAVLYVAACLPLVEGRKLAGCPCELTGNRNLEHAKTMMYATVSGQGEMDIEEDFRRRFLDSPVCNCKRTGTPISDEECCPPEEPPEEPVRRDYLSVLWYLRKVARSAKKWRWHGNNRKLDYIQEEPEAEEPEESSDSSENPALRNLVQDTEEPTLPWAHPIHPNAQLIVGDPGIWKIPNFVGKDVVTQLLEYEQALGQESDIQLSCHGMEGLDRRCFVLANGQSSKAFPGQTAINQVAALVNEIWPTQEGVNPEHVLYTQNVAAGNGPMCLHFDVSENDKRQSATVSMALYLSDGGAGLVFPNVNVTVVPEKGMAVTWLNVYEDGETNQNSAHAVQAMPRDADNRISLNIHFSFMPHEIAPIARL